MKRSGLLLTTEALSDNSTRLWTAANHTQNDFRSVWKEREKKSKVLFKVWMMHDDILCPTELSHSLNAHKDSMRRRRDKGETLRFDISSVSDEIKSLQRGQWFTAWSWHFTSLWYAGNVSHFFHLSMPLISCRNYWNHPCLTKTEPCHAHSSPELFGINIDPLTWHKLF